MIKNRTVQKAIVLVLMFLVLAPLNALAAPSEIYTKTGNIFSNDIYPSGAAYQIDFVPDANIIRIEFGSYSDSTYSTPLVLRTNDVQDYGYEYFTGQRFACDNTYYQATFYTSAGQAGFLQFKSGDELIEPTCDSSSEGAQPPGEGTCDSCAIFECPGWSDYMSKLDGIQASIPPPPDWPVVADVFRDSIAPRIKEDMRDLLGTAPTPPAAPATPALPDTTAPTAPAPPPELGGVDDGGLTAPTGQEAPGLGDAGFNAGDIQTEAPVIEERTDPTGGFTITDPTTGLPTQEEFKQQAPAITPNPVPAPPAPAPNPAPAAPAPTTDFSTAPIPPGSGTGDYDTPPIPAGTGTTEPTTPLPDGTEETGSTTPIPPSSGGDFGIPIPGASNETAP